MTEIKQMTVVKLACGVKNLDSLVFDVLSSTSLPQHVIKNHAVYAPLVIPKANVKKLRISYDNYIKLVKIMGENPND
jgi:hypothetical protein